MKRSSDQFSFEDSIADDWSRDMETVELRLEAKPNRGVAIFLTILVGIVGLRVLYLNVIQGSNFTARAEANVNRIEHLLAPRGLILDRKGTVLAENRSVFRAVLKIDEYSKHPELSEETLSTAEHLLGVPRADIEAKIKEAAKVETSEPIVLLEDLSQDQVVKMKALTLPTLAVKDAFMRHYPQGEQFSSLLGYVSLPTAKDLKDNPGLSSQDLVGKAGLETQYDELLQGEPGMYVRVRNAKGKIVHEEERRAPEIGTPLSLTIDAEFQKYFADRLKQGLQSLGRTTGGGIAIDPRNGEVLALMSFPSYDNNVLSSPGRSAEKRAILTSPQQPLFDRMVGGNYSPGSVVKPLHSVALLKENIVDTNRTVFSPGYLDVPNPYNPAKPSRYLDWRYQGDVDMYRAIAYSSDVYYYVTVGGFGDIKGLGITRLKAWWERFGFGRRTGIDLPGEGKGFLPDPDWKEKRDKRPWLLGDTFNVSIGQGDLQTTPVQILNYISAIANGGSLMEPTLNIHKEHPKVVTDLTSLAPEIREVQKGMRQTVTNPKGTASLLNSLPFKVFAKTGSAQIQNNTKENAFFVGYIAEDVGAESPIAIIILVEDAVHGSSNTIPIARDVLNWYYENRLK